MTILGHILFMVSQPLAHAHRDVPYNKKIKMETDNMVLLYSFQGSHKTNTH